MNFFEVLEKNKKFNELKIALDNPPISVVGIVESAMAHFVTSVCEDKGALIVMYSEEEAKNLYKDLNFFCDRALYFPHKEYVFYNIDASAHSIEQKRIDVLGKILDNPNSIVVTSIDACLEYTIPKEKFIKDSFVIEQSNTYDIEDLCKKLINMGYTRSETVEGFGQFSVRGGIVDIFSPAEDFPYRIEFFDDEVDSVRIFDYISQRTLENVEKAKIYPCKEAIYDDEKRLEIIEKLEDIKKSFKRKKKDFSSIIENLDQDIEILKSNRDMPSIDKYAEFLYDGIFTLLDYFNDTDFIYIHEPKRINEKAKSLMWESSNKIANLLEDSIYSQDAKRIYMEYDKFLEKSSKMKHISVNSLNHTAINYQYKALFEFESRATVSLHGKIDYLIDDLKKWQKENKTVIVLASNRSRGENISGVLNDKGIKTEFVNDKKEFKEGKITIMCGELKKGFEYPECDFLIISEQEIFNAEKKSIRRKIENTKRIKSYNEISIGDYVVHQTHGIGKYDGMKRMTVNGVGRDYLKIQYRGTDSLYIPVDQMDLLYKYVGNTDKELKLNKLNSQEWNKTKAKVKKSTEDIAKQLVSLYAQRLNAKGFAYPEDGPWQRDFEDTFLYEETDDQLRCIEEVKNDMESIKPMDRLLCGDVGYGKTEIAIRAAFKAAVNSKQVAYLCPTTVLAMQHYDTFSKRMSDFAIKVEMLSRFRTPAQQKKILKDLKNGTIDIIIGTHKLLQNDVCFKDLGLLIIDEEQRFGVKAKEKLKELKKNIDVLSMTATPIPRTLHMSMINIRDMSVLETPPENRYPVQTYVMEYNESVIMNAIKRELSRGGQVFYLHNRVDNIYSVANKIANNIPEARVSVGHGQMREEELEDIMYDMVNAKTDVLVCTTIIETGLDIPNANTIIIDNADRMGLAQLYQLRGRVGRSNKSAYAYFTYRSDLVLSEIAQKRLRAIREFTEFGSGFKIAMRDLEIRGAGSLLGAQQHGHMDDVGYDMYCKILKESIDEALDNPQKEKVETSVEFNIDAYIPEQYIKSQSQRIDIYKKIAAISCQEDAFEVVDELIDRYSTPPKQVLNLIEIAQIKAIANSLGITDVNVKKTTVLFKFLQGMITPEIAIALMNEMKGKITISSSKEPTIIYRNTNNEELFDNIKFVLQAINRLKNEEK